jgi:hypothetical protein
VRLPGGAALGQRPHAGAGTHLDTGSVPTKRALAKADAAELIDIEARLAPFFPPPVAGVVRPREGAPELQDQL